MSKKNSEPAKSLNSHQPEILVSVAPGYDPGILSAVEGLEVEQQALLEAAPVEQVYEQMLAIYVQAKGDQVENLEHRLEILIDKQQTALQQIQGNSPEVLSMPGARRSWWAVQAQAQSRLQTLHSRLDLVREIREEMGVHSPKIEELATRKMRIAHPELAADWDSMREATRRHQLLQKQKETQRGLARGRGQSLGLSGTYHQGD